MERVRIVGDVETGETVRVRFKFLPQWEGAIQGYAINYIERNGWTVKGPGYDEHDLLQEAWVVFDKVEKAYPAVVDPPHFMALFKTALRNHFINLAKKKMREPVPLTLSTNPSDEEASGIELEGPSFLNRVDEAFFREDAPEPVRRLIRRLVEGSVDIRYQWSEKTRETTREFLARVSGYNSTVVELVLDYLNGFQQERCDSV